jgi:hypothetical protein
LSEILKGKAFLCDGAIHGRVKLKCSLKELEVKVIIRLNWLGLHISGGLLLTRQLIFGFHKKKEIS